MKIILTICMVFMISAANAAKVTDVIDINVAAIGIDGSRIMVGGTVTGIASAPLGDYQVNVTNGKSYTGKTFTEMTCNILPVTEIITDNKTPLFTTYIINSKVKSVTGYVEGSNAYPTPGYKVTVKNGKNRLIWNSMNCVIK